MMTWGKKAGPWGKGVEGLNERPKEDINEDSQRKDQKNKGE
jgi:protein AFG1